MMKTERVLIDKYHRTYQAHTSLEEETRDLLKDSEMGNKYVNEFDQIPTDTSPLETENQCSNKPLPAFAVTLS
jgi:hypothetical protein